MGEHILLSFAAIDLSYVVNLSAYINCLIKEHDTTTQICLYFLAGMCPRGNQCPYVHPCNGPGWDLLEQRWGITFRDFDFTVLNYLSKKPTTHQDAILTDLADANLRSVKNLSAYLSSVIQKAEQPRSHKGRRRHEGQRNGPVGQNSPTDTKDSKPPHTGFNPQAVPFHPASS
eukprot:NODE_3028_length_827_cov_65.272494_g2515_i0.p1 GENE.NODE_3028_length_827_cov_65.272494_g2515_i0~~NODE_3028_length_827_cov_65.272494_g2515_i0.p1  ORF type:complete len:189 (-),score=44.92 NODE_3028_length_827_cov_65.272494_g2515_i0:261-779(-)